jgi:hypothetical protein
VIDIGGFLPELEHHVYILATVCLTVFFGVEVAAEAGEHGWG